MDFSLLNDCQPEAEPMASYPRAHSYYTAHGCRGLSVCLLVSLLCDMTNIVVLEASVLTKHAELKILALEMFLSSSLVCIFV